MKPLLSPRLRVGDTIGYFSPSLPATSFAPKRHARAVSFLESKGFTMRAGALTGASDTYRSGTTQARVQELNALIRDPEVRCIMSTIGGSNSNSLLPYIDYDALRADPKIIVGYSDVTAILLAVYAQTGLQTFYGPALVASFGELMPLVDETYSYFFKVVMSEATHIRLSAPARWTEEYLEWEEQERAKVTHPNDCLFEGKGVVKGRLIGGNLNTMTGVWGSQFMPTIEHGDILLVEDSLKDIATVEKLFAFLKLNGVFDRIGALLLGKHELFDDKGVGRTPRMVLEEILDGMQLPIVSRFDCAHTHPMLTLPLGGEVEIDFDREVIEVACAVA